MKFNLTGTLQARLCGSIKEPLSEVLVKVYLAHPQILKEGEKLQPTLIDQKKVSQKADLLVGTGRADLQGNYNIALAKDYNGGPVEIHLEISKIPHHQEDPLNTVQCMVHRLQPVWRGDLVQNYNWNYRLPYAFWMRVRAKFNAWVILGHIKDAHDQTTALSGVQVSVKDYDWMKDDFLGSCETDQNGFFRIDYQTKDFKKTYLSPLINIETPISVLTGPGVYFKVVSNEGLNLLEEQRKTGKKDDRKNIPRCFYISLLVPQRVQPLSAVNQTIRL